MSLFFKKKKKLKWSYSFIVSFYQCCIIPKVITVTDVRQEQHRVLWLLLLASTTASTASTITIANLLNPVSETFLFPLSMYTYSPINFPLILQRINKLVHCIFSSFHIPLDWHFDHKMFESRLLNFHTSVNSLLSCCYWF